MGTSTFRLAGGRARLLCSAIGRGSKACLLASSGGLTRRPGSAIGAPSQRTILRPSTETATTPGSPTPADATRIFTWLICESYDDKGNAILYRYKQEDDADIDARCRQMTLILTASRRRNNRLITKQFAPRYLKNIQYGNRQPREAGENLLFRGDWLFEVCSITANTTKPRRRPRKSAHGSCGKTHFRSSAQPLTSDPPGCVAGNPLGGARGSSTVRSATFMVLPLDVRHRP